MKTILPRSASAAVAAALAGPAPAPAPTYIHRDAAERSADVARPVESQRSRPDLEREAYREGIRASSPNNTEINGKVGLEVIDSDSNRGYTMSNISDLSPRTLGTVRPHGYDFAESESRTAGI